MYKSNAVLFLEMKHSIGTTTILRGKLNYIAACSTKKIRWKSTQMEFTRVSVVPIFPYTVQWFHNGSADLSETGANLGHKRHNKVNDEGII